MPLLSQNPGRFDKRASFFYPLNSRGGSGGAQVVQWVETTNKAWGHWLPTGGREFNAAAQKVPEVSGLFRIRYRADVRSSWRVNVDGTLFEVVAIAEAGRFSFLDLTLRSLRGADV